MRRIKPRVLSLAIAVLTLSGLNAADAQCTLPYTLTNGQLPDATRVMANFNALASCLNVGGSSNAIQYKMGSGNLAGLGPLTDGQVVIGSTGNPPQAQTLTAGPGITIANGAGSVAVSATAGAASSGLFRQVMSAVPTAASTGLTTWVNQGVATFSEAPAGLSINAPSTGVDALILRYVLAPAPPYTLNALIGATRNSTANGEVGIGWYDGGARFHILSFAITSAGNPAFLQVAKWSAFNFRVGNDVASATSGYSQPIWLQLKDDGTNVSFAFSQDGANFLPLFTVAKASAYLGPNGYNNFILFVNPRGGQAIATAMSWAIN